MNDTKIKELYDNLSLVMKEGDEEKAKQFLVDNFKSFPEEMQSQITAAFIVEALQNKADEIDAVSDMQKSGLDAILKLEEIKSSLEVELKSIE